MCWCVGRLVVRRVPAPSLFLLLDARRRCAARCGRLQRNCLVAGVWAAENRAAAVRAGRKLDRIVIVRWINRAMNVANITVVLVFAGLTVACVGETATDSSATPRIVEVFACSDYCPGPKEKYMKRVYEGVTDDEECRSLGGRLYTITGWGKRTICEVQ